MQVQFKINKAETKTGQSAFIIGGIPQFGAWDVSILSTHLFLTFYSS